MKKIDLSGKRFGRLLIMSFAGRQPVGSQGCLRSMFNALCDCGKECVVSANRVQSGNTKSCGCLRYELSLRPGGAARELYGKYVKRSKGRGVKIELTLEEFIEFVKQNCFYCGAPPSQIIDSTSGLEKFKYNGIDRWNNDLEYTKDNMVPCCGTCNKQKLMQSGEEFIVRCQTIASRAHSILFKAKSMCKEETIYAHSCN
jgi:hypothetical protein